MKTFKHLFSIITRIKSNKKQIFNISKQKYTDSSRIKIKSSQSKTETETEADTNQEDYNSYIKSIKLINSLKSSFNIDHFNEITNFLNENLKINNKPIIKDFEYIFFKNQTRIDQSIKSKAISYLSQKIISNSIDFDDAIWEGFFNCFIDEKYLSLYSYYSIIISFDSLSKFLTLKYDVDVLDSYQFFFKFRAFLLKENGKLFNSIVELNTVEEVFLLSKLIHSKILSFQLISDYIIKRIDELIRINHSHLSIKISLVLPCLIVIYQDNHGDSKASIIFNSSIRIINEYIVFLYKNYDFLDGKDKETIDNLSDNLIYYAYSFFEKGEIEFVLEKMIKSYKNRLILREGNINWINEMRILLIISNKLNYTDEDFWELVFSYIKSYMTSEFDESLRRLFKNQIKQLSNSDKPSNKYIDNSMVDFQIRENSHMNGNNLQFTGLFYIGIMLDVGCSMGIDYNNLRFLLDSLRKQINFASKDILYNLQFIYFHCNKLYTMNKYILLWNEMINIFNPKIKRLLLDRNIIIFIMKSIFERKNIVPTELSSVLTLIFFSKASKKREEPSKEEGKEKEDRQSNIELFCIIYELLDGSIKNSSEMSLNTKVMSNAFVDLIKYENSIFSGIRIKAYIDKMVISNIDLFKETVYERVKFYIKDNPSDNSLLKIIILLHKSGIFHKIDLLKIIFFIENTEFSFIPTENTDFSSFPVYNLLKSLVSK